MNTNQQTATAATTSELLSQMAKLQAEISARNAAAKAEEKKVAAAAAKEDFDAKVQAAMPNAEEFLSAFEGGTEIEWAALLQVVQAKIEAFKPVKNALPVTHRVTDANGISHEWVGRGRQSAGFIAAVAESGKSVEDFKIEVQDSPM
jgi:DNA-binding protein H-NS